MARTRQQRKWAAASTGQQLRFIAIEIAFILLLVDILLGSVLPLWVALVAGLYVFLEGSLKALSVARSHV